MFSRLLLLALLVLGGSAQAASPVILIVGDSIGAGHGITTGEGWVALLGERLRAEGHPHRVVNASVSGDTTAGGRTRLPAVLDRHTPEIVVIELGGNDGLRGLPLDHIADNLEAMIVQSHGAGARIVLAGMRIPPNYGPVYTERFNRIYRDLAARHATGLVPFLLEGIGGHEEYMQPDGIHPNTAAQPLILDNLWPHLEPLLFTKK